MVQSRIWTHGSMPTEVAVMQRLMIVADNSFAAQSIRLALRQTAGFQVVGFVDGSVPIDSRVVDLRPDFVVVDDAHEADQAFERVRELSELLRGVKIVFLTIRMHDSVTFPAFEAGADAVISKPVHPVSLATLLREIARETVVHRPRRSVQPAIA